MKEFYYINMLEASRMKLETKKTRTPLETAVVTRKFEVVSHPVMQRLIENKWMYFGKTATILDLSFFVIFNVLWTAMSMLTPPTGQELYDPLSENIWRVVLLLVIGIMIIYQVGRQVRGMFYICSLKQSRNAFMQPVPSINVRYHLTKLLYVLLLNLFFIIVSEMFLDYYRKFIVAYKLS